MSAAAAEEELAKRRLAVKIPKKSSLSPATEIEAAEVEEGEPLSPAARLFRQPQLNCHIIVILGLGKIIDTEELKAGLEATLVRHPRFSSVQKTYKSRCMKPRWVRTKVNLDDHVVLPDIGSAAAANDTASGDRFVEEYAAGLCRSSLDQSRPLWDLHLLPVRTSEATAVAIFRIHHSLGDGMSLMSLFLACTLRTSDFKSVPSIPEARRRPAFAAAPGSRFRMLLWLWTIFVYAWNTFVDAFIFISSAFFLKDTKTTITGSEGVEFRPKRFVHRTLSLDDIKGVKDVMGCTVNDVLVGVTSAALSRYLSRSNDGLLPKNLCIRTTLLVNIRQTSGIQQLTDMMKKGSGAKWGNRFGYIVLRFPVMNFEDPLEYVRRGTAIAERKKKSFEAIFTYTSGLLIFKTLGIKAITALCYRVLSNTTLSFSSIVGPMEEVGFCGAPLVYIAPSVYGHPQALTIHFQSYRNKMEVVLAVDEPAIPDPHKLLNDIADSLQLIKEAVVART